MPRCATRLPIFTSLVRLKTPAAPGQYVFAGAPLLHSVKLATAVVELPRVRVRAKPAARDAHALTLDPDAALVVPVGHVRTTALEL